ncbi:Uncharacterised protein [uncultured archaeon]|nr:Uncharacterised protein [uncultured archaeon]
MQIIGTTTVTDGNKIVLISKIAKKINAKKGDTIVFFENEKKEIIIQKA